MMLVVSPLVLQYVTMNVRDKGVGVRSNYMCVGNDSLSVCDIVANGGHICMCVYCKLGLEVNGQQQPLKHNGTHVEDTEDPDKLRIPGDDHFFVIFCMEKPRYCISFTLLGDPLLNLLYSPVIENVVNGLRVTSSLVGLTLSIVQLP